MSVPTLTVPARRSRMATILKAKVFKSRKELFFWIFRNESNPLHRGVVFSFVVLLLGQR